jgi:hypothetical protein
MAKLFGLGSVLVAGLGVAAILTNPQSSDYEAYTGDRLNSYLKENMCAEEEQSGLGGILQSQCKLLLETATPQMGKLVTTQTERQNFFFFSFYESKLSLPAPLPSYQVNSIGIFKQFFVYRSEQVN